MVGIPEEKRVPFPGSPGPPPRPVFMLSTSTYRTVSFTSPTQSLGGPEVCPTCSEATWSGIKRLWGLWLQPGCTRKLTSPSQPPSTPRKAEPWGTARAPHSVTLSKSSAWWSLSFLICEVGIIRHHPTVRQKDRIGASHPLPQQSIQRTWKYLQSPLSSGTSVGVLLP